MRKTNVPQQCICVKRGWRVIQRFRIFNAFVVGDKAWLRKPRSNANTHVGCQALKSPADVTTQTTTFGLRGELGRLWPNDFLTWRQTTTSASWRKLYRATARIFFAVWQREFRKNEDLNFFSGLRGELGLVGQAFVPRRAWTTWNKNNNVEFDSTSWAKLIYLDSNASTKRYGRLETSRK